MMFTKFGNNFGLSLIVLIEILLHLLNSVNCLACYYCVSQSEKRFENCLNPPTNGTIADIDICQGRFCSKLWAYLDDGSSIMLRGCTNTTHSSCNLAFLHHRYYSKEQLNQRFYTEGCVKVCRYPLCNSADYLNNHLIGIVIVIGFTLTIMTV